LEHIGQYVFKLRLFPFPLSGVTFVWFILFPPNSIHNWLELE
jgi:hypothetical protein